MNVAVTGGTGFLGRYIVSHLAAKGHSCRCWYRPSSGRKGPEGDLVEWLPGELEDARASTALVQGCDAVVHSALHHPDGGFRGAEGDLREFLKKNFLGTIQLIQASQAAGVGRFVFISTCAVHEKILDDRPLDETHPLWPTSHYGAHKAALEKFVHSFGLAERFPICALRPTGIYGIAHPIENSKWFDLVGAVARGDDVCCRRGGKVVHAADVAQAVDILLRAEAVAGEAYNCCDLYVSDYHVAEIASEICGNSSKIEGHPTEPKHQIVTRKLHDLGMRFGGRPLVEQTIRRMIDEIGFG